MIFLSIVSVVCFSLTLAGKMLGFPFPPEARPLTAVANDHPLIQSRLTFLSQAVLPGQQPSSLAARFCFRFQVLEHPQDRWLCAIAFYKSLVTPTYMDTLFFRLPPSLYVLYQFMRPFRLLKEWLVPTKPSTMSLDTER